MYAKVNVCSYELQMSIVKVAILGSFPKIRDWFAGSGAGHPTGCRRHADSSTGNRDGESS